MSADRNEDLLAQLLSPAVKRDRPAPSSALEGEPAAPDPLKNDPLAEVLAAENPILEAARPLLRTLADLPGLPVTDVGRLRELLMRDVKAFQNLCERAGFRRDHALTMRYCLCTALDEAVSQMPWARASDWMSKCLLITFHNEAGGGEKFFLLLGRMSQAPREYLDILEAMYHILSLGFQGRYALMADGRRQLELIHSRLLEIIQEHRPPRPGLSVNWKPYEGPPLRLMRALPVWVSASVAGLVLLGLLLALKSDLDPRAQALAASIAALDETPARDVFAKPSETPLEFWFSPEQRASFDLKVPAGEHKIILPGDIFASGVVLRESFEPLLDILAERLGESRRAVSIVGHTDSVPLRRDSVFKSNEHLSEERAKAVAAALAERGVDAGRLKAVGVGDREPAVAGGAQDNPLNRRVELIVHPEF